MKKEEEERGGGTNGKNYLWEGRKVERTISREGKKKEKERKGKERREGLLQQQQFMSAKYY